MFTGAEHLPVARYPVIYKHQNCKYRSRAAYCGVQASLVHCHVLLTFASNHLQGREAHREKGRKDAMPTHFPLLEMQ